MKHIKLYNENHNIFNNIEIDFNEYKYKYEDDRILFSEKEISTIEGFLNGYDLSLTDIRPITKYFNQSISSKKVNRINSNIELIDFEIFKTDDDWFYLFSSVYEYMGWDETCYKCDSIGGLLNKLDSIFKERNIETIEYSNLIKSVYQKIDKLDIAELKRISDILDKII